MVWMNIILDHISKFKVENISKLERKYLDNYGTDESIELSEILNERVTYYKKVLNYSKSEIFLDGGVELNEFICGDVTNMRLRLLWEIILEDDFNTFVKIYNIPYLIICSSWDDIEDKYKMRFIDYWKSYYGFNI